MKSRKGATNDKDINKIEKNVRTSEEKFGKAGKMSFFDICIDKKCIRS
jgi:hypothetical protein